MNNETNVTKFLNEEVVDYASYSVIRTIGSLVDGLKNAHRKVLYYMQINNINNGKRVFNLSGEIMTNMEYLHGDISGSVITLAQNYSGTNNIPLLTREGNFGTRFTNEASAVRYIYTAKEKVFDYMFLKKDSEILITQEFEGNKIEPRFLLPTLPIIIINGSEGIATGFAQKVLSRDALKVKKYISNILNNKKTNIDDLIPSFNSFSGNVVQGDNNKQWIIKGSLKKISQTKVEITEIPIGYDLKGYTEVLDNLEDNGIIKSYIDKSENDKFNFIVTLDTKTLSSNTEDEILDKLKLTKKITENYTFVDENNKIVVYENIEDVINHYIKIKLEYTQKRLEHQINELKYELKVNTSKAFFIMCVIKGDIILMNKKKDDVIEQIKKFDKIIEVDGNYNYVLSLPLYNLTQEKFNELKDKVKSIKEEIKDLESKTPKEIWLSEIEELEKYLKKNGY